MANQRRKFPSYGIVRGPSHERGGVPGTVNETQPVELEGGEWIIPKEVVPDYLPVLKQITNEGRAMQQMQNGNSAMDALIASASMENGLTQPKSPMYQEGGRISNFFKKQKENFQRAAMMGERTGTRNPFLKTAEEQLAIQARNASPLSMRRESPNISLGELEEVALVRPYRPEVMSAREQVDILPDEALEEIQMSQDKFKPFGRIPNMPEDERGNFLNYLFGGRDNILTTRSLSEDLFGTKTGMQQGGMIEYEDGGRVLAKRKLIDDMSESNGVSKGYSRVDSETLDLDTLERVQDIIMERNIGDQYGGIEDALVSRPGSVDMGEKRTYANRFDVRQDFGPDGNTSTSREQLSVGSLPVLATLANLASRAGVSGEGALGRVLNASLPIERRTEDGRTSFGLSREQGGPINNYQMGGMVNRQPMMQRPMNPAMNFSPMQQMSPRMYQDGGQVDKGDYPAKDMEMLKQFPLTYKFFMDRRGRQSYYPEQDSLAARMFRGEINPNEAFSQALMLPLTQEKGKALPRKQQEIRNPNEVFGPPDSLVGRTYMNPRMYEDGGQVQLRKQQEMRRGGNPNQSNRLASYLESMNPGKNLMGAMASDKRVAALKPDTYVTTSGNGVDVQKRVQVPKLAEALLPSYGIETPYSKKQGESLIKKGIAPQVLNSQVKGLINRALLMRLSGEGN